MAVVGLIVDQRHRAAVNAAYEKVNVAMGPERKLNHLSADDVHKLLGREPDEQDQNSRANIESYHWRGALLSYTLFVTYYKDGVLKDVSVDKPPQ